MIAFAAIVIGFNARFFYHFYGDFNRNGEVYHLFHVDLMEACDWLKPRFDDFDAVYITTRVLNMPYVITAVAMSYSPEKWFSEPIELAKTPPAGTYMKPGMPCEWDFYTRYGKMHFIYDYSNFSISDLQKKFAPGRVLLILRPDDFVMFLEREKLDEAGIIKNLSEHIVHRIYRPDGVGVLWLYRL